MYLLGAVASKQIDESILLAIMESCLGIGCGYRKTEACKTAKIENEKDGWEIELDWEESFLTTCLNGKILTAKYLPLNYSIFKTKQKT